MRVLEFVTLAEAQIALRHAERERDQLRAGLEQKMIEEMGGVKNIGPNLEDQRRAFRVAFAASSVMGMLEDNVADAEDALDRAKAAVREYECETGARLAVFHD